MNDDFADVEPGSGTPGNANNGFGSRIHVLKVGPAIKI
jgi:hypothetical protein